MTILIVEDETDLTDVLSFMMRREGHDVVTAMDGDSALRLWRKLDPELILLDIGLPTVNGWEVCRTIRSESRTPILILSGCSEDSDIAQGFELGAEDYVTKPFSPRILQARVRAIFRRQADQPARARSASAQEDEHLSLDQRTRVAASHGRKVQLTNIELQILKKLLVQRNQVVTHQEVIEAVWGYRNESGSKLIKGHILNLRRKLGELDCAPSIEIISGVGYMLVERVAPPVSA